MFMLSEPTRKSAPQSHGGGRNHVASRGKAFVFIVIYSVSVSWMAYWTGLAGTEPLPEMRVDIACFKEIRNRCKVTTKKQKMVTETVQTHNQKVTQNHNNKKDQT